MKRAGYTLAELLIASSVSLVLVAMSTGIYVSVNSQVGQGEVEIVLAQNGRAVIDRISRDVRQAVDFATEIPAERVDAVSAIEFEDGHSVSQAGPTYIEYSFTNVTDGIGEIVRQRHYYYHVSDNSVHLPYSSGTVGENGFSKQIISSDTYTIAEDVASLEFYGTDYLVKIDVTLQQKADGETLDLHSAVAKRN